MSNRDHAVNGGTFLDDGTLLIAVGGMTNQGMPGVQMGGLPESPLSGAILQAKVTQASDTKSFAISTVRDIVRVEIATMLLTWVHLLFC